jgi:hypothetical protein
MIIARGEKSGLIFFPLFYKTLQTLRAQLLSIEQGAGWWRRQEIGSSAILRF